MTKSLIYGALLACVSTGCADKSTDRNGGDVNIALSPEYYDLIVDGSPEPQMVVLAEDDNTMYTEIDKVVDRNGKFFILDRYDSRTLVAFNHDGTPYARYGSIGTGPGEYVMPHDFDVDENGNVYILDARARKLIRYATDGTLAGETQLPFTAQAMTLAPDGNFIFNIMPDGTTSPRLCIADSTLTGIRHMLSYEEGYTGGLSTSNIFRRTPDGGTVHYNAPLDTLYAFNGNTMTRTDIVFDFKGYGVPDEAKKDFLQSRADDKLDGKIWFSDTPIPLKNGLWVGILTQDNDTYTAIFNPTENICGTRKHDRNSSVYDILWPLTADADGHLISMLDAGMAEECADHDTLPDSIRRALDDGNSVLVLHQLK